MTTSDIASVARKVRSRKAKTPIAEHIAELALTPVETVAETEAVDMVLLNAAAEADLAAEEMLKAEKAAAGSLMPAYLKLGEKLAGLRALFSSDKLFGQHIKAHHPVVASIDSAFRSTCMSMFNNETEILNHFGWNSLSDSPWVTPATVLKKWKADIAAQSTVQDSDDETSESEGETAPEANKSNSTDVIEAFMVRFGTMSDGEKAVAVRELLIIGFDRKIKASDL